MEKPKTITVDEKIDVRYCIPNWLRDEQIRINTAKIKGRIQEVKELRSEPIALVSFGPSLKDTWESIKNFKYVMTCSGAHKFLVERGIIPTHHIDVDPRKHKIGLIGEPQKETEYLLASTCHPDYFDFLLAKGIEPKIWHVFDTSDDGLRLLPHGEWAITGGCSVGVRLLTVARFLGFTDMHIFGMDGCSGETGCHAAEHPNQPKQFRELEYDGKIYHTTPGMLEAAKHTWHELDILKDVKVVFYGDGLVQAMYKNWKKPDVSGELYIAFNKEELISAEYRRLNEELHTSRLDYGVGGGKHADTVKKLYKILGKKTEFVSVLDYGAGKGYLAKSLPFPIAEYDPAIPSKAESPRPADLVVCTDVLEHIEPDRLRFVLGDLQRVVRQVGYFTIHTGPALKTLPDGRNTHLIQKDLKWWKQKLERYFAVGKIVAIGPELHVMVAPLTQKKKRTGLNAAKVGAA